MSLLKRKDAMCLVIELNSCLKFIQFYVSVLLSDAYCFQTEKYIFFILIKTILCDCQIVFASFKKKQYKKLLKVFEAL